MKNADKNTSHFPQPRPSRRSPKTRRRKTPEFSVISREHQAIVYEALVDLDASKGKTMLRRKRSILAWLTRRLAQAMEVHGVQS